MTWGFRIFTEDYAFYLKCTPVCGDYNFYLYVYDKNMLLDSSIFTVYVSGTELNKAGKYVFYGLDDAGNSTGNYTIIIDRTIKKVTLSGVTDGTTNGDVKISWTNGNADTYAPITSVKVNGKAIINGKTVYTINTGEYVVSVLDAAGNTWTTTFTSAKQNVLTDTLQKEYFEVADKDGNIFAFATYEAALEFATARENGYVTKGTWNSTSWDTGIAMDDKDSVNAKNGEYFIYKKSGAASEQVAYFTAERLNEVIAEYAKASIKNYYYWQKAPATVAEGENLYTYADENGILANKIEIGQNVGVLLDGEEFVAFPVFDWIISVQKLPVNPAYLSIPESVSALSSYQSLVPLKSSSHRLQAPQNEAHLPSSLSKSQVQPLVQCH